jgi:hypothetical protein
MSERRGFWSERLRAGEDDARLLAAERLHDLRQLPYSRLRERAERDAEIEQVAGMAGEAFRRRTTVKRFVHAGEEELRVTIQVTRASLLGRLNPLAEEVVTATPDGQMVGDYTLAGEGNDPRRYAVPRD